MFSLLLIAESRLCLFLQQWTITCLLVYHILSFIVCFLLLLFFFVTISICTIANMVALSMLVFFLFLLRLFRRNGKDSTTWVNNDQKAPNIPYPISHIPIAISNAIISLPLPPFFQESQKNPK